MAKPGLLILASGLGERFESGDKLMADLGGNPVLGHVLDTCQRTGIEHQWIAIGADQNERLDLARRYKINRLRNPEPARGQAGSIILGATAAREAGVSSLTIVLGDMPLVGTAHLLRLQETLTEGAQAVMSKVGTRLQPPAIFSDKLLVRLEGLTGDQGARKLFCSLDRTTTLPLGEAEARDIDTVEDLADIQSGAHHD